MSHPCNKCNGTGTLSVRVLEGANTQTMALRCVYCDGSGTLSDERKAVLDFENALWCQCAQNHGSVYHEDGQGPDIHKHHWRCKRCGKVTQIG